MSMFICKGILDSGQHGKWSVLNMEERKGCTNWPTGIKYGKDVE